MGVTNYISEIALKAFAVVLLGGLDSIVGALIAGMIVGISEGLATGYLSPIIASGFGELTPWIILLLVVLFKPYGLFGLVRIERI